MFLFLVSDFVLEMIFVFLGCSCRPCPVVVVVRSSRREEQTHQEDKHLKNATPRLLDVRPGMCGAGVALA